jgi:Tat protein translocase TatB subunit
MFGIGMGELFLILIVAFLVVGPRDLPKLARALGRLVKSARRAVKDISETIDAESLEKESGLQTRKETEKEIRNIQSELKENIKL